MELLKRIEKLKKSEKKILSDIYWTMAYAAMLLIILLIISYISLGSGGNPAMTMLISILIAIIYTLVFIYLIGLAVAFGTIRARREFLKAEIDVKEEETQQAAEGEEEE
jgi:lipopolysaccharide export LptBFGC system permease protein LptF